MDPELTEVQFRQFVTRRGIGGGSQQAATTTSGGTRTNVSGASCPLSLPSPFPLPIARTYNRRERRTVPHQRRGAQRPGDERKVYVCEICGLSFGRKHHKERHVANIHRQVRSILFFFFFLLILQLLRIPNVATYR